MFKPIYIYAIWCELQLFLKSSIKTITNEWRDVVADDVVEMNILCIIICHWRS